MLKTAKRIVSRQGFDIEKRTNGYTPLQYAVTIRDLEAIEILLEAKADIFSIDEAEFTFCHLYCFGSTDPTTSGYRVYLPPPASRRTFLPV